MLGTSLGKVDKNGYSAIDKTSFGADTTDKSSFFTGKPYVEGLGYAFLLRNYRADMGKWLSQDLVGYPDGWNNFAYCNNSIISSYDLLGAAAGDIYSSPDAAAIAWGNQYNGASISSNKEYGSSIYQNGNGYSYTEPNIGESNAVAIPRPPSGAKQVADIHSHGAYGEFDPDNFSSDDRNDADNSDTVAYLANSDGGLYKYDPKTKKTTLLDKNLPKDPNHPKPASSQGE